MHYHLFDTAFGTCGIVWSDAGLARLQLPESSEANTENRIKARGAARSETPPEPAREAIGKLLRYFRGEKPDFSGIAIDLRGVDGVRVRIYGELRKVGWGETVTYGELGKRIGVTGDAREVGQAMGRNPVPIIIPCHRVLAAGHKIGGFSAPGGTATKERLLALEGVQIGDPLIPGLRSR